MNGYNVALNMLQKDIQIIPLTQFKKPTIAFKDIDITPEFIEQNIIMYQQAKAFGVLTRNVWCIDIDVGSKNGYASMGYLPYKEEIEWNMRFTMLQVTPSGGMHIIFKKRKGVPYQQKLGYLDGVDIKANHNNYFVMGGSVTSKGIYEYNDRSPIEYDGEFENQIFESKGSYADQIAERFSVKKVLKNHDFSHLPSTGKGGRGKDAYQRILDNTSIDRNNDLYLAASYAKQYGIDLEPLKVLIGDVKNCDEFTESEWIATVNSAGTLSYCSKKSDSSR